MDRLLRLRLQDPADLSDVELRQALAGLRVHSEWLGPDRLARLVRAGRDRLGLSWVELGRATGYPFQTMFSWCQWARQN